ncbi:hypothetical protein JW968_01870 [Candidatus Woesearchaeota archaeon]|nr:hypothetical protein [Candidatus Woesearchaeota archaeon]
MDERKREGEKTKLKSFVPKEDYDKLERIFHDELKRKDEMIEALRKDSHLTMHTAIRQADKNQEIIERLNKALKDNAALRLEFDELKKELEKHRK